MRFKTIIESLDFNKYDKKKYTHYEDSKNAYNKRNVNYNNVFNNYTEYKDENISDKLGEKWLYVKDRDFETIALACIDGLCDGRYIDKYVDLNKVCEKDLEKLDNSTKTKVETFLLKQIPMYSEYYSDSTIAYYFKRNYGNLRDTIANLKSDKYDYQSAIYDLRSYCKNNPRLNARLQKLEDIKNIKHDNITGTPVYAKISSKSYLNKLLKDNPKLKEFITDEYNYLMKYTKHAVKVYRGFNVSLTTDICKTILDNIDDKAKFNLTDKFIKLFDNTSKAFSSFSTDKNNAERFASSKQYALNKLRLYCVLSGYTIPNNISYALTAFLSAKYDNTGLDPYGEHELTLMNISSLRDPKIELDMYHWITKSTDSYKMIKAIANQKEDVLAVQSNRDYIKVVHNNSEDTKTANLINVNTGKFISDKWFKSIYGDEVAAGTCYYYVCETQDDKYIVVYGRKILPYEFDSIDYNNMSLYDGIDAVYKGEKCHINFSTCSVDFEDRKEKF